MNEYDLFLTFQMIRTLESPENHFLPAPIYKKKKKKKPRESHNLTQKILHDDGFCIVVAPKQNEL